MPLSRYGSYLTLSLFGAWYLYIARNYFWVLPAPSDALEYLQCAEWGSAWGYWPWLDRISLGVSLGFLGWLPFPVYQSGPWYAFFVSLASMLGGAFWLLRRCGFPTALAFCVFAFSGYYSYYFATQIFPEPTLILYSLIAVIFTIESLKGKTQFAFLGGFFALCAALTKITCAPLPLLLGYWIYRNKKRRSDLKPFGRGAALALLVLPLLFAIHYGWNSLTWMVNEFFQKNFLFMYKGTTTTDNIVSYYDLFIDRTFLPVYLGLVVVTRLYEDALSKKLAAVSWMFFLFLYAIHIISGRGGSPIVNYMYPAFFFATMALACEVGKRMKKLSPKASLAFTVLLIALFLAGMSLGRAVDPPRMFSHGMFYLNSFTKIQFNSGVIALLLLLVGLQLRPRNSVSIWILLVTAYWTSAYAGGLAYSRFRSILIPEASFYYENAPALANVPANDYDIYVEAWLNERAPSRIAIVYKHFFDPTVKKNAHHQEQWKEIENVRDRIRWTNEAKDIPKIVGPWVLTDNPKAILKVFPRDKIEKQFTWNGMELFVMSHPKSITPPK